MVIPTALGRTYLVSRIFASWNQLDGWLRQVEALRIAAAVAATMPGTYTEVPIPFELTPGRD
jgi:hypothetical protein